MIADFFRLVVSTLIHRKLRSVLTVLGIVIGITAVVALISLGKGLQFAINEQFNSVGTNRVIVRPAGNNFGPPTTGTGSSKITEHDIDIIKKIDGVSFTFGFLLDPGKIESNSKTKFGYIQGIPDDPSKYGSISSIFEVVKGRSFKPGDRSKAIIGNDLANKDAFFGKPLNVGDKITIEGKTFDIIGIRKKTGNPVWDQIFIIPITTHRAMFNSGDKFAIVNVEVSSSSTPDIVADKIKKELRKDRHLKEGEEDFAVETSAELLASFNTVLGVVQAVLIGIATISLVVGGVGIMNTMYTSVLERTKDIGILKSIGAKDSDILILFLIESGTIGLIGGIIGTAIGIGLGKLVEFVALQIWGTPLIKAEFPPYLIIGALMFSFIVGSIAGILPARQASKMNPVDALRYE
ncbi:MAG: ABC transporter permease [Nanoarchaeota archaeon]